MSMEVRPAADRFRTDGPLRTTAHSFSFGVHYDPHNVGFGALIVHNDELLEPGGGYPDHPHVDTEIVTWVLSGALRHTDDHGHSGVVLPGQVQRLSAGSGVVHAEVSDSAVPTRFLQAWVRPDESGLEPSYLREAVTPVQGGWTVLAGDGGVPLNARGAALHLGQPTPGVELSLPDAPRLHLFVASGSAEVAGQTVGDGDAVRLLDSGALPVRATTPGTQLLVWSLS
jgi:redox-sensitive bicupin YhaK (pirin superfamily)